MENKHPLSEHALTGGSTFTHEGRNLSGSRNWVTGVYPEAARISERPFSEQEYEEFKSTHSDLLSRHPNAAIGTHFDPHSSLHTMEVVGTTPVKSSAHEVAHDLGEHSVFGLEDMKDDPTGIDERQFHPSTVDERLSKLRENNPHRKPFSGVHYSDKPLDVIEGGRRGSSGIGAEASRLKLGSQTGHGPDAPSGFYAYESNHVAEGPMSARKSSTPVRGHFAFASTEDENFKNAYVGGKMRAQASGADEATSHSLGLNSAEHAVKDAGFDGYINPAHAQTRFLFGSYITKDGS